MAPTPTPADEVEELSKSLNVWQLVTGKKMACHDVESPKMMHAWRRFSVLWDAAVSRFNGKLSKLAELFQPFTEESHKHPQNITNPMNGLVTDAERLDRFASLTQENHPTLVRLTRQIDEVLGTHSRVSIKSVASIRNKAYRPSILRESPWFRMEHLRDSLRFMTAITDIGQVASILDVLLGAQMTLAKIDVAKLVFPKSFGWRFIAFDLRMPNGQLVEYYISFERMVRVMEDTHRIYEKYRQQKKDVGRAFRVDRERSQKCYGVAFMRSLQDRDLGPTTFILRWIVTMERMLKRLETGQLPPPPDGERQEERITTPVAAVVAGEGFISDINYFSSLTILWAVLGLISIIIIGMSLLLFINRRHRRSQSQTNNKRLV